MDRQRPCSSRCRLVRPGRDLTPRGGETRTPNSGSRTGSSRRVRPGACRRPPGGPKPPHFLVPGPGRSLRRSCRTSQRRFANKQARVDSGCGCWPDCCRVRARRSVVDRDGSGWPPAEPGGRRPSRDRYRERSVPRRARCSARRPGRLAPLPRPDRSRRPSARSSDGTARRRAGCHRRARPITTGRRTIDPTAAATPLPAAADGSHRHRPASSGQRADQSAPTYPRQLSEATRPIGAVHTATERSRRYSARNSTCSVSIVTSVSLARMLERTCSGATSPPQQRAMRDLTSCSRPN